MGAGVEVDEAPGAERAAGVDAAGVPRTAPVEAAPEEDNGASDPAGRDDAPRLAGEPRAADAAEVSAAAAPSEPPTPLASAADEIGEADGAGGGGGDTDGGGGELGARLGRTALGVLSAVPVVVSAWVSVCGGLAIAFAPAVVAGVGAVASRLVASSRIAAGTSGSGSAARSLASSRFSRTPALCASPARSAGSSSTPTWSWVVRELTRLLPAAGTRANAAPKVGSRPSTLSRLHVSRPECCEPCEEGVGRPLAARSSDEVVECEREREWAPSTARGGVVVAAAVESDGDAAAASAACETAPEAVSSVRTAWRRGKSATEAVMSEGCAGGVSANDSAARSGGAEGTSDSPARGATANGVEAGGDGGGGGGGGDGKVAAIDRASDERARSPTESSWWVPDSPPVPAPAADASAPPSASSATMTARTMRSWLPRTMRSVPSGLGTVRMRSSDGKRTSGGDDGDGGRASAETGGADGPEEGGVALGENPETPSICASNGSSRSVRSQPPLRTSFPASPLSPLSSSSSSSSSSPSSPSACLSRVPTPPPLPPSPATRTAVRTSAPNEVHRRASGTPLRPQAFAATLPSLVTPMPSESEGASEVTDACRWAESDADDPTASVGAPPDDELCATSVATPNDDDVSEPALNSEGDRGASGADADEADGEEIRGATRPELPLRPPTAPEKDPETPPLAPPDADATRTGCRDEDEEKPRTEGVGRGLGALPEPEPEPRDDPLGEFRGTLLPMVAPELPPPLTLLVLRHEGGRNDPEEIVSGTADSFEGEAAGAASAAPPRGEASIAPASPPPPPPLPALL